MRNKSIWFLVGDIVLLVLSMGAAVWLRFDGRVPPEIWSQLPVVVALSLATKLPVFAQHHLYALSWGQVSLEDVLTAVRAVTVGTLIFWAALLVLKGHPRRSGSSATSSRQPGVQA